MFGAMILTGTCGMFNIVNVLNVVKKKGFDHEQKRDENTFNIGM